MTKWDKYEDGLVDRMYEEAHQAWIEEKEYLLEVLSMTAKNLYDKNMQEECYAVNRAIKFIERSKD